ncbi:Guanidine nucleotide exchange factor [Plasmodium coatneyi]|uniref:Guanidine nucleotide exchange factor n=1 Tax=Plasmodium coatneyi TaxID=208452 RepID=A0A1B1E165_9APIC|nr:Guanidine nucleotide exchange factor [Plasmodium coatneyi]ANQ08597.1 Guanidine nucleotide exchange factor [Plasmodium coatneyi]
MNAQGEEESESEKYIFSFAPKVSAGLDHFACVGYYKNKPTVFCWGGNTSNQLGVGINTRECKEPTPVPFFEDLFVSSVCCTYYCTFVLAKRNAFDVGCSVYSFGKGNNGLLGFRKKRIVPSKRVDTHAGGKEKLLQKLNKKVDQTLLDAFGVSKGREPSPPVGHSNNRSDGSNGGDSSRGGDNRSGGDRSGDDLLHFDVENISSEEGSVGEAALGEDPSEKADWFTPVPMKVKFQERTKIKFISCGDMHTLAICTRGYLYGWGSNAFGCVGNGTNANVYEPVRISLEGRKEAGVGDQLGGSQRVNHTTFPNEPNRNVIIHCSAGGKHSLACTLRGDIYSWGYGANGRLGFGNIQSYNRPQLVKALHKRKRIIYVCAGKSHSGCIDAENNVYTWGNGKYFKLGHGDENDVLIPKRLEYLCSSRKTFMLSFGTFNSLALSAKGDVFLWGVFTQVKRGSSSYTCKIPKKVNTNYKCLSVHASVYLSLGVTVVGDLIVLGDCSRIIAPGGSDGPSNAMLKGKHGGDSDSADSNVDVLNHLIGREANWIDHLNRNNEFPVRYVKELRGKVHIKDILRTFYMLDKESSPSRGGEQLRWDDERNLYGDDATEGTFPKKGLIIRSKVKMIDGSEHFSVFLLQSGKIYTSGVNKNGELANGEYNVGKKFSIPITVEVCVNRIVKIACGYNYTLALNERGLVYGWGKNDKSQLGIGVIKDCYEPVHIKSLSKVIDVYAGHDHSACIVNNTFDENALKENSNEFDLEEENLLQQGELYTWGNAESGKVGLGADYTQGAILLPRRINLTNKVHRCSLGNSHTLILTNSNELYVCGSAISGKLGLTDVGTSYMVSSPRKVYIDPSIYVKEMVAGATYSMVLSMDGFIYLWGEFIKNEVSSEVPMLYSQISNVKHIIGGKDKHVLFHTYDNKLFGLGDNTHMQILHDVKETSIRGRPKLIPYFMRDRNIETAYSFKNATFVQLEGTYDLFAWGYTSNCHLGIGVTNATHLKQPKKVVKSWVTYEEAEPGGDNDSDVEAEQGLLGGPLHPTYGGGLADEVELVRRRVLKRTQFEDDLICASPYQEEEVENMIKRIQVMPHLLNWDAIQMLLKKERYTNSIQYVRSFERDLIDIYTKHMEVLLNLHSQERKYNELLLTYQHYVLSNVVFLKEERPSIMFSQHTQLLDCNREKLQRFVYILQQQPLYLVILCRIHNCKNVKYGSAAYAYHAYEYGGQGEVSQDYKQLEKQPNLPEQPDRGDRRAPQDKRNFYLSSTRILCSFIFDLYHDLRDERVRTIFTIFLIKLGVEEIDNCLHVEALFREDTSIFFLLIRMLFLKNEILAGFARCLADMGNANSFVRLLDSLSRCVPGGENAQLAKGAAPLVLDSSPIMEPTTGDGFTGDSLPPASINRDALARASLNTVPPKRQTVSAPPQNRFIDEANDPLDKEFAAFMKGKLSEKTDPLNLPINMYSELKPVQYSHLGGKLIDHPQGVVPPPTGQNLNEPTPASQKNVLVEVDMVHVFRELCKLFEKMIFPEIFQTVVKNLFKHLSLCEMNSYSENLSQNRIFYFSGEHFVYVPFYHLLLMGILHPMLGNVDKLAEKFYFPVIPPHVTNLCKRVSSMLEVFCINRYDCLSRYNLRESFVSVKFILERTFCSMVTVTNMLCRTKEDVYLTAYINLFSYHLSFRPCYVYLKVFQLCHLFNLFFRFQNYLCLSFDDPAVEIVNEFFSWQGGGNVRSNVENNAAQTGRNVEGTAGNIRDDLPSEVTRKMPANDAAPRERKAKQSGNFLLRFMTRGKKEKRHQQSVQPMQSVQPVQPVQPQTKTQHERRLIFSETQIDLFAQCKLVYNIQLDTRFLLEEKNMSICEFTRIPMPQSMCYRKKTRIRNREYLFSIIQEYKQPSDEVYIVSECLRGCPLLEPCIDTSTLLAKLKALRANFLSLAQQKEANLVGLIDKALDIFMSNEMVHVSHQENIPPNLYTHKFKLNHAGQAGQAGRTEQAEQPFERFFISQRGNDGNSFFFLKWRNIAVQICLDILKKKKHLNFLRKLHERQGKIEELIFMHQNEVRKNIDTVKRALIFVSKLFIERPILVHASLFGKNLFFVKMKMDKNSRRRERSNFFSFCNTSTVHVYSVKRLLQDGVLDNLSEMLLPVVDLLSLEIFFDIENALKLSLVLVGGEERKVLHVQTFRGRDIQRMYSLSPFISYGLFPYNRESLCSLRALRFVHLLHDLVIDLY